MYRWKDGPRHPRRTFLKRFAAIAGGIVAWRATGPLLGDSVVNTGGTAVSAASSYLSPRYLPAGYRLAEQQAEHPYGGGRGQEQLVLEYTNASISRGSEHPLLIYQSLNPRRSWFTLLQMDHGKAIPLTLPSKQRVSATYSDGWRVRDENNEPVWKADDMHSLAFSSDNLAVGLRGSRLAGLNEAELVHIASSLA